MSSSKLLQRSVLLFSLLCGLLLPVAAFASFSPGQTLDPSCVPSDPTCIVVNPSATNTAATFVATSSSATSTFAGGTAVAGTASSTNLVVSNIFTISALSGFLKATAGLVSTALVNLTSDVTGILPIANGGTASSTLGGILVGNGTSAVKSLVVGSNLTFDGTTLSATGGGGASFGKAFEVNGSGATAYLAPTTTLGIIANASSTIGNGTQGGGLTINGGATTTGNLFLSSATLGTSALNTNEYNIDEDTIAGGYAIGSLPTNSPLDFRWDYTGVDPTTDLLSGPTFYTTVDPSNNTDNHAGAFSGITGTVYSNSADVLQQLIGGRFAAIRTDASAVATNPIFGVTGVALAGDQASGLTDPDGTVGGMFTAFPYYDEAQNAYNPYVINGTVGSLGRVIIYNKYLTTRDSVATAGYVDVDSSANNVTAGRFDVNSNASLMSDAGNAYGINVGDIAGAQNLNMAIHTGAGTVQFGDDLVLGKNIVGGTSVMPIGTPTIVSVQSGCDGLNGCSAGGTKTYTYKVVAVLVGSTTSAASQALSVTTGFDDLSAGSKANVITWTPVEGAVGGYNIYRTATNGATTNTTGLIGHVAQDVQPVYLGNFLAVTQPSYADTGAVGDGTSPPTNNSTGNFGVGTSTPYAHLSVWGPDAASSTLAFNVVSSASTTVFAVFDGGNAQLSGTLSQSSDQRLKTNITSLDASSSLAAIDALTPVTYNWLDPEKSGARQYGFIAQQVQQVFPELVSTTSATALTPNGTLALNYLGLIAPMVKAIQTIATEVASLTQVVSGFAESFTSHKVTTDTLCVTKSDGTPVCITGDQLSAVLAGSNQTAVQISDPTPLVVTSGTSTPPSITIAGNNPAIVQVGSTYMDLGATAVDSAGHTLSLTYLLNGSAVQSIAIDTSSVATDTINYVATDTYGNTSTSTRTVLVTEASSTSQ